MSGVRVGLDLGGTKIYGVLLDGTDVVAETKRPTTTDGVDAVIADLVDVAQELAGDRPLAGVGVGTPGVVDPATGTLQVAPNIAGFDRPVALRDRLADGLGVPVVVHNDVNAAAYGEAIAGAARGHGDVLAIWMGTGLGGGLILDGVLRTGSRGLAAEIGHTVVVPDGRRCGCGGRGHLEAYIGRRMLEAGLRDRAADGEVSLALDGEPPKVKSKAFRKAYDAGDRLVVEAIDRGIELLAIAVHNVALTVEIDAVVIGGGLGERFVDIVAPTLSESLAALLFAGEPPVVVAAELGDRSGAVGAALLASA